MAGRMEWLKMPLPAPAPPTPAADESPFAVRQRIYTALPLPLGATSACEWLEVVLTERFEAEDVRSRLQVLARPPPLQLARAAALCKAALLAQLLTKPPVKHAV